MQNVTSARADRRQIAIEKYTAPLFSLRSAAWTLFVLYARYFCSSNT